MLSSCACRLTAAASSAANEDIDHSRTKTKSPQTNGICERFHKTALNEFYRVAFRKKVYRSIGAAGRSGRVDQRIPRCRHSWTQCR
jgi:transposase InsO family protein